MRHCGLAVVPLPLRIWLAAPGSWPRMATTLLSHSPRRCRRRIPPDFLLLHWPSLLLKGDDASMLLLPPSRPGLGLEASATLTFEVLTWCLLEGLRFPVPRTRGHFLSLPWGLMLEALLARTLGFLTPSHAERPLFQELSFLLLT